MEVWGTPVRGTVVQAPGRLEVIGAEDGFIREPCVSVRRMSSSEKAEALIKGSRDWQKGKLQVLGGQEAPSVETPIQQSSVGSRQVCPRRKVYTPTKQISLCTARSTPEIEETYSEGSGDKKSICTSAPNLKSSGRMHGGGEHGGSRRKIANAQSIVIVNHNTTEQLSESTDDDDTDSSSDEFEENEKAPIELIAEFLKAVMDRDYNLASKLCQMILLYEPDNSEAQHFVPLIKEKLLMEENDQNSENEDDEEEDSEDSESEESTDGSNTDDSSDETSDSSSDPEEDS
ncbi:glutamate-rich protein 2 [Pleurodeles waltl]|uniref:glutamate-rich protein 2 n=1 Tax=Pleurodeles waltl TaxID=8319 RepID=UPI003709533C